MSDIQWETWEPVDRAVLCFLQRQDEILLIHKKRGLGNGKINGPGGRIEPGETAIAAAIRETEEEVGLCPTELRAAGELSFLFLDGYGMHVHVFFSSNWTGEPVETDEALPFWCRIDQIPYDRMWQDDRYWLPAAIAGSRVEGRFIFDGDRMVDHILTVSS